MKIRFNKITSIAFLAGCFLMSCSEEATDISTITKFEEFNILGLPDKIELPETDSIYTFNYTFDDKQIIEFHLDVAVDAKSTATEDLDFALPSHSASIATLQKSGSFELQINSDLFLENDESIFLTFTSDNPLGSPLKKTIEVVIKNVGGCPEYVHSQFVGDYEVVSDGWQDWAPGTILSITDEGTNKLGFKYNCADAKPIILTVEPASFSVGGTKQPYCVYGTDAYSADVTEATSSVNTCDKVLTLNMLHFDPAGASASYGIVLKKK